MVDGSDRPGPDGPSHAHDHGSAAAGTLRPLAIALLINTGFLGVEFVGALLSGSLALLADAAHMATDSASLGLALFAAWLATRPPDAKRTYGYYRAEVLGALGNGVFLVAVVVYILVDAYQRVQNPPTVDPVLVVGVGVLGLVANLAAAAVLTGHRGRLNVEGAFLHLVADAAGSVAAIVAGGIIWATGIAIVDPIVAVLIAGLVLYSARDLLADSLNILLQGTPRDIDIGTVRDALEGIDGVREAHHVHVWALDSRRTALSAHLLVEAGTDRDAVLAVCRERLAERFGIDHATIQLESDAVTETIDMDCYPSGERPTDG